MNYPDLDGQNVLVTGSSSGIGAATARAFSKQGAYVGVHYFQSQEGGLETFADVKARSEGCLLQADLREKEAVDEMVSHFVDKAGGIDVVINNAGSLLERTTIEDATVDFHDNMYATNVRSVFLTTKAALPHLKDSHGAIVNVGSIAGHTGGSETSGIYASAKSWVATQTMAMANEFAEYGIRVNSVLPGVINTRFHQRFSTPDRLERYANETPLNRLGKGEDVAKAILFLASDAADFITGEYVAVNGGLHMRV